MVGQCGQYNLLSEVWEAWEAAMSAVYYGVPES